MKMDNLWHFVKPCTVKMSRKRFVKLCMGRFGFSRNFSNWLASIAQPDSYSYKMAGLMFLHAADTEEDTP